MLQIQLSDKQNKEIHTLLYETFVNKFRCGDENYYRSVLPGLIIAGGAIPALLQSKKPKDYDVYFTDPASIRCGIGGYYGINTKDDPEIKGLYNASLKDHHYFDDVHKTDNALTLSNQVQIVTRFIGEPESLFQTFDYEHCKCFWRPSVIKQDHGFLHFYGRSMEAIIKRELIYTGSSRFAFSALKRHEKFISRGWTTSDETRLRLIQSVSKVNWKDPEVLQKQVCGYYSKNNENYKNLAKEIFGV